MTDALLSTAALFEELERLDKQPAGAKRQTSLWTLLSKAKSGDDFQVALDFVLDHHLATAAEVYQMRLRCDGDSNKIDVQTRFRWNEIDSSQLVWIEPGPYLVGPKNEPATSIGFYLARYPVTNEQFKIFIDATGYRPSLEHPNNDKFLSHWDGSEPTSEQLQEPVVFVSMIDSWHYCKWANLELPTEWLWEKAARGSDGRRYPWGSNEHFHKLAHVRKNTVAKVTEYEHVRSPYGCHQMLGNVSEWCRPQKKRGAQPEAWEEPKFDGIAPSGNETGMAILRGSAFIRNSSKTISSFHRRRLAVTGRNYWTGFRTAYFPSQK